MLAYLAGAGLFFSAREVISRTREERKEGEVPPPRVFPSHGL